jgi:hypothetical protein
VTSYESVSSHCNPLIKLARRTVRVFVLAWVVSAGVWFGIRSGRENGPSQLAYRPTQAYRPIQNDRTKGAVCAGISVSDSDVPFGYTFIGLKRIDRDCFAMFKTNDTAAAPTVGGGFAEVSGQDGRLTLRFAAIALPNEQWEVIEYRRLRPGKSEHQPD